MKEPSNIAAVDHPTAPIILKDGAKIQAWIHEGSGTPLIFLYGLGCSINHWKYQLRHVQSSGRLTVHLDYRGHGASTLGDALRPLSIKTLSHDLKEIMDQLSIDVAVLLGQSMGGSIALQFAHDHPNRCAGLILQGSPGRNPIKPMQIGQSGRTALKFMIRLNQVKPKWTRFINHSARFAPAIAREVVRLKGFNPSLAKTEDIEEYIQHFLATDPNLFYELADDLQDFDISKLDHLISQPALILAGAQDKLNPIDEAKWLAKRLPMAELEVIPHGSHCSHLDDPVYINDRIDRFLSTYNF